VGFEIQSGDRYDKVIDCKRLPGSWGKVDSIGIVSLENPMYSVTEGSASYLSRRGLDWIVGVGTPSKIDRYYGAKPERVALVCNFKMVDVFDFCESTGQEAVLVGSDGGRFGLHVGQPFHLVFERGGRSSYEWEKENRPKGQGAESQERHHSGTPVLEEVRRIGAEE
jgi:hypothetical protein|tara:strand:- start:20194 stop:20694 length:501 start_codon:yes stop_codon:yes gene_type:complete